MENLNIDFISNNTGSGDVASMMMANGKLDIGKMRPYIGKDGKPYVAVYKGGDPKKPESYSAHLVNNATLRREEWIALDQTIIQVAETRLNGIQDLIDNGLVYGLGNAMGTTVLESHTISDAQEAVLTMDGITRSKNDRVKYGTNYLPIPIIHVDYEINARVLAASRALSNPLDTSNAERAARKVAEKLESMLFTNTSYAFGGGTIYSYLNHPDRNQVSLTTAWSDSAATGATILSDVQKMKAASIADRHYGPWMLYVPTAYETILDEDYSVSGQSTQTIRERIMKIGGIKGIKVVDTLTANNVLLVQMTADTVRLVRGLPLQNIQWKSEGDFVNNYKVLTIQVPQIRSDYNNRSGVVHMA